MKFILNALFLITIATALVETSFSQDQTVTKDKATETVTAPTSATPQPSMAQVFFYRTKSIVGSALEPSVFCDEKELARMDNGRYFAVTLEPGKHTCFMDDKNTGFDLGLKAGDASYAKVTIEAGFWKGHGRLALIQPEQATFEIKKLKLLAADKVKNRTLVTTYEGSAN